jgi:hypothetical protein
MTSNKLQNIAGLLQSHPHCRDKVDDEHRGENNGGEPIVLITVNKNCATLRSDGSAGITGSTNRASRPGHMRAGRTSAGQSLRAITGKRALAAPNAYPDAKRA